MVLTVGAAVCKFSTATAGNSVLQRPLWGTASQQQQSGRERRARAPAGLGPLLRSTSPATSSFQTLPLLRQGRRATTARCRFPPASQGTRCEAHAATEEQRVVEQGEADVEQEVFSQESKEARDVVAQTGEEKDRPKFVPYDYGFQAAFLRSTMTVPGSAVKLAFENFGREYEALRRNLLFTKLSNVQTDNIERTPLQTVAAYAGRAVIVVLRGFDRFFTLYDALPEIKPAKEVASEELAELREKLQQLQLSNRAVWDREHARPPVKAPWWILGPYYALCFMLDVIFNNRPIQRFWFLETVARMPYFSYISMLHLYETLGWWRVGAEVRKVHFAEEWNEMHHLKIMESLGGDRLWIDRFFAQHAAFFYYWILNAMFLISPRVAYNFSELIEMHAVDTYGCFADTNTELLKSLPPSPVAVSYYYGDDLYMFDEFQTSRAPHTRRPKVSNLYDVFCAIRDDELEHVKTMAACQQLETKVVSPNRLPRKALQTAVPDDHVANTQYEQSN